MIHPNAVGLTLGKFAPLHRGHQFVIETALAECSRVLVLLYDAPDTTPIPLPVRRGWIEALYPTVEVLEAWDAPTEVGDRPEIIRRHDDDLRRRLATFAVSHFYSSEFYGDHVSRALGAVDRRVDPERRLVPVSGTVIRESPFANRHFVNPLVYFDLITRVVLLGAPSTGKTTLTEALAARFQTVHMPEYGREYWDAHQVNHRLTLPQLEELAAEHLRREQSLELEADRYLFSDTNALTTRLFALDYHHRSTSALDALAEHAATRADLILLCGDDIPYHDTPDRSGQVHRRAFQRRVVADLQTRRLRFDELRGSLTRRIDQATTIVRRFEKYGRIENRSAFDDAPC